MSFRWCGWFQNGRGRSRRFDRSWESPLAYRLSSRRTDGQLFIAFEVFTVRKSRQVFVKAHLRDGRYLERFCILGLCLNFGTLYFKPQSLRRTSVGSKMNENLLNCLTPLALNRWTAVYLSRAQLLVMVLLVAYQTARSSCGRLQRPSLQMLWVMSSNVIWLSLVLSIFVALP